MKRFGIAASAIALVPLVLSVILNYVVDPFAVFQTKWLSKQIEVNDRFLKIEFLNSATNQFSGLMWGSSRIGSTPPKILNKEIPNSKFYNMFYGNGTLSDHLANLTYITIAHPKIRTHYIQIDLDLFMSAHSPNGTISFWRHPLVERQIPWVFYLQNLLTTPFRTLWRKINLNASSDAEPVRHDITETGMWFDDKADRDIAADPDAYITRAGQFQVNGGPRRVRATTVKANRAALRQISLLCSSKNLQCIFFTTPHHRTMLDSFVVSDYLQSLELIASEVNFWDFSYYNSVTNNDLLYYEGSHYRACVGELIAARIFSSTAVEVPHDFGIHMTIDNMQEILALRKAAFEARN